MRTLSVLLLVILSVTRLYALARILPEEEPQNLVTNSKLERTALHLLLVISRLGARLRVLAGQVQQLATQHDPNTWPPRYTKQAERGSLPSSLTLAAFAASLRKVTGEGRKRTAAQIASAPSPSHPEAGVSRSWTSSWPPARARVQGK